ncbi:tetratricopeptide (TPR) repeat protein [Saonia flava]|uniref:Tetratricopeptide (TPR) repeat protein n=1 Tax=Saonia flava TaxID=523696 RepID=A0A846QTH5_9FLAO|nr:tetratricopeptide repeat protein [Saonia flava]NJB70527.1 tetratricopeptide (TPR) repeat protein [Saonia flava]
MKSIPKTSSFFSLFLIINLSAQDNKKLDSLSNQYNMLANSKEKVETAERIFVETRRTHKDLALSYLHKGLSISRKISYLEGEAMALKNLGFYYSNYRESDSVPFYFEKAISLFEKIKNKKEKFKSLLEWTRLENLEGNFDKALRFSKQCIALAQELENGEMISDAFQRKSTIHLDKGEYKLATEALITASRVLDTLKEKKPLKKAIVVVGIGRTEVLGENYSASLSHLQEGLETFKEHKDARWQAITYMELGSAYYHLEDYEKSLENYNRSLEISKEQKWQDFEAANLGNIGAVYMEQKDYKRALQYFFRGNEISIVRGSINNQIINYNDIASTYYLMGNFYKALENYNHAVQLADSIQSIDNLSDALSERANTYEKMGAFQKSIADLKASQKLKDSIFNENKSKQIEKLKTQYETEKKEQQIVLQEQEITVLQQKASISNLQKLLMGIGLLLSLLGFYALRQKMKRNKLEKEKVDAELEFKKKELTTHALHLAKKNETLESLKQKAEELKLNTDSKKGYTQLISTINFDLQDDNNWENFSKYFEEVHKDFNSNVKIKYPEVTSNELRLMALLKMNLSSKEIANILNISQEGIKKARYRLRKKLDITSEDSLQDLVLAL